MKPIRRILSVSAALLFSLSLAAQTAEAIVAKHLEAMGGEEKLAGIHTVYIEGTVEVSPVSVAFTSYFSEAGARTESKMGKQVTTAVVTREGGWMISPAMGIKKAAPMPVDQYKASMLSWDFLNGLVHYDEKGYVVTLLGEKKIKGKKTYKIGLSTQYGNLIFYIDQKTFYIVQAELLYVVDNIEREVTCVYNTPTPTDYGTLMSLETTCSVSGIEMTTRYKKIVVNTAIDPSLFDKPEE